MIVPYEHLSSLSALSEEGTSEMMQLAKRAQAALESEYRPDGFNIGMNLGLLPVTGIPLPFLSYGGSSLLVTFIALGTVQNVARQSQLLRF